MGFLDPKALRDWIKSRAVNNLMATAKGFFLDARVGPVIQEKIDEVKEEVDEINGNLLKQMDAQFAFSAGEQYRSMYIWGAMNPIAACPQGVRCTAGVYTDSAGICIVGVGLPAPAESAINVTIRVFYKG